MKQRSYTERRLLQGRWNARCSRRSYRMLNWDKCEAFAAGEMAAYRAALIDYRLEQSIGRITETVGMITKGGN